MKRKWMVAALSAIFVACAFFGKAQAETITVKRGDTLTAIAKTYDVAMSNIVAANRIENPNRIKVGQRLHIPQGNVQPQARASVARRLTVDGYTPYTNVGGAPLSNCGGKTEAVINEEAWTIFGLSEEEKRELRSMILMGQHGNTFFKPGDRFASVAFCEKGKVVFTQKMVAAWDPKLVVLARTYVLKSGRVLHWMRNCNNWIPGGFKPPTPTPPITPPVTPPTVLPPAEEVPPTVLPPVPTPVMPPTPPSPQKIACDEWNVHASAGAELSKGADTRSLAGYVEGEVGACPFKWEGKDGVSNEVLLAGRLHASKDDWHQWHGKTTTSLLGLGLRRTDKDGAMDLYRLMVGQRTGVGSEGLYSHDARWNVGGLYGTHYRVKPDGTDETHYRWGILLPLGGAKGSASWDGTALSLPRYNGSLEVGVRRYFTKQGEDWRWLGELNGSIVSPDYKGIGPRIGVCNGEDTFCVLAGVNIDVQNGGTAAMVGVQINTPGIVRVGRDGVIMERMAKAAEVKGVKFYFAPAQAAPRSD